MRLDQVGHAPAYWRPIFAILQVTVTAVLYGVFIVGLLREPGPVSAELAHPIRRVRRVDRIADGNLDGPARLARDEAIARHRLVRLVGRRRTRRHGRISAFLPLVDKSLTWLPASLRAGLVLVPRPEAGCRRRQTASESRRRAGSRCSPRASRARCDEKLGALRQCAGNLSARSRDAGRSSRRLHRT